jgi:hypothetical protein
MTALLTWCEERLTVSRSIGACSGGTFDGDVEVGAVLAGACETY